MASLLLAVVATACDEGGTSDLKRRYPERTLAATVWDTILSFGPLSPNDTTLVNPDELLAWGDRLVTIDRSPPLVSVFSRGGELLWRFGRQGSGPEELRWVGGVAVTPWGGLWVLDGRNAKVLEFDSEGHIRKELPFTHFPVAPITLVFPDSGTVLFSTQSARHAFLLAETDSLRLIGAQESPWAENITGDYNLRMSTAGDHGSGLWAQGLTHGPGFIIGNGNSSRQTFSYVSPVPWALKASPALTAARADSARFGAVDAAVLNGEIYFLFGGRPYRAAHPPEPTELIDVYDSTGTYQGSYALPLDSDHFALLGPETFALLGFEDGIFPRVYVVRPVTPP